MPPKAKFSKEEIVQAAFNIVQQKGLPALTARRVARNLKSSTAPVYSYFQSMNQLEREVIAEAVDMLHQYTLRPYTDRVFLNMGTGIAIFARDQSNLFRALFLEKNFLLFSLS